MCARKKAADRHLTLREVRKRLKGRSNKELITLISKCYHSGSEVKRLLTFELSSDEEERSRTIEDLRSELHSAFWSEKRGVPQSPNLRRARRVVSEVGRLTQNPSINLYFMLEYVHNGAKYSHTYGDMNEAFYSSLESMFQRATRFTVDNQLYLDVQEVLDKMGEILDECSHFGWGVEDNIREMMTDMEAHLGLYDDQTEGWDRSGDHG